MHHKDCSGIMEVQRLRSSNSGAAEPRRWRVSRAAAKATECKRCTYCMSQRASDSQSGNHLIIWLLWIPSSFQRITSSVWYVTLSCLLIVQNNQREELDIDMAHRQDWVAFAYEWWLWFNSLYRGVKTSQCSASGLWEWINSLLMEKGFTQKIIKKYL